MKKSLTALAVSAAMLAPMAVQAAVDKVYGRIHVAVENVDAGNGGSWEVAGGPNKASALGVKGAVDTNLMDMKAVYKLELGLNMENQPDVADDTDRNVSGLFYQRDTWVGLSSKTMGTVRAGTLITPYKQSGKMIDPLFYTTAEGRGALGMMSGTLHGGTGDGRGRSTNTIRYDSPRFAGAKFIVNYNLVPTGSNNSGMAIHYKSGPLFAFVDYQSLNSLVPGSRVSATKFGGKYTMGNFTLGGQYEIDGGAISERKDGQANTLFLNGAYKMGATTFTMSFGTRDETVANAQDNYTAWALAVLHAVAKQSAVYVGYGSASGGSSFNDGNGGISALTAGMIHNF